MNKDSEYTEALRAHARKMKAWKDYVHGNAPRDSVLSEKLLHELVEAEEHAESLAPWNRD